MQCKICNLPAALRETTDDLLRRRVVHTKIVDALLEAGHTISKSAVQRHAYQHLGLVQLERPGAQTVKQAIEDTPPPAPIRFESTLDKFRAQAHSENLGNRAVVERRISQLMLEQIVQNQLAIVASMQNAFMRGESEYPRDPITGLKAVMDLIAKLPSYNQNVQQHRSRQLDAEAETRQRVDVQTEALRQYHAASEYRPGCYYANPPVVGLEDLDEILAVVANLQGPDEMALELYLLAKGVVFNPGPGCDVGEAVGAWIVDAVEERPGAVVDQAAYLLGDEGPDDEIAGILSEALRG